MFDGLGRGTVLLPMANAPLGPRLTTVPLIVTAGPFAERVVPAIEKAVGLGVNTWPATVYACAANGVDNGFVREIVVLPIANAPDLSRLMAVPATVTAGPPAETIVPATEKAEGLGVKVWPATASTGVGDGSVREMVLLPIARIPEWSRLIGVPSTV